MPIDPKLFKAIGPDTTAEDVNDDYARGVVEAGVRLQDSGAAQTLADWIQKEVDLRTNPHDAIVALASLFGSMIGRVFWCMSLPDDIVDQVMERVNAISTSTAKGMMTVINDAEEARKSTKQ